MCLEILLGKGEFRVGSHLFSVVKVILSVEFQLCIYISFTHLCCVFSLIKIY